MSSFIYPLIPLIGGIFTFWLGLLVLLKNRKAKVNQTLFAAIISITAWLLATFAMFLSKGDYWAIFWDRVVYIGVILIPVAVYHFGLSFTKSKEGKLLYLGYFLSFIFLVLSRTDYFVADLYKYSWGMHTQARFFHHIFLIFFVFYISLFFLNIYLYQRKVKGIERTQANYILLAFFVLALSSLAFLPAYGIDIKFPFPYFTTILCVLILTLAIIKYHLFEIRVILTELLVAVMGIVLLVLPFLMPSVELKLLTGFVLVLFLSFGYLLIKYTHSEIKRKEEAETLAVRERVLRKEAETLAEKERQVTEQFQVIAIQSVASKKRAEEFAEREKVLRQRAEKLARDFQRLNEVRNQLFLTGHHHTRTPLAHIKNLSSMLLEKIYGAINKKQKWAVKTIFDKAQESIDLANLYLSVAELEVGKEVISKKKTKLGKIVGDQIKKLSYEAKLKNIEIITKIEKDLPEILADPEKIGVVYFTILDNGLKYTSQKGGKIVIGLNNTEKETILFSCQDNGIGIEEEEISNLGQVPYQRSESARGMHGTGKGLALYLSNLIVKAHQGKLWAESEGKGKGTTFFVELPLK